MKKTLKELVVGLGTIAALSGSAVGAVGCEGQDYVTPPCTPDNNTECPSFGDGVGGAGGEGTSTNVGGAGGAGGDGLGGNGAGGDGRGGEGGEGASTGTAGAGGAGGQGGGDPTTSSSSTGGGPGPTPGGDHVTAASNECEYKSLYFREQGGFWQIVADGQNLNLNAEVDVVCGEHPIDGPTSTIVHGPNGDIECDPGEMAVLNPMPSGQQIHVVVNSSKTATFTPASSGFITGYCAPAPANAPLAPEDVPAAKGITPAAKAIAAKMLPSV